MRKLCKFLLHVEYHINWKKAKKKNSNLQTDKLMSERNSMGKISCLKMETDLLTVVKLGKTAVKGLNVTIHIEYK